MPHTKQTYALVPIEDKTIDEFVFILGIFSSPIEFHFTLQTETIWSISCLSIVNQVRFTVHQRFTEQCEKMKLIKIVLILFALCMIIRAQSIVIDIDPEDIQLWSEFLGQCYVKRNMQHATSTNNIASMIKKASLYVIQLLGLMFSLVGANILSELFTGNIIVPTYVNQRYAGISNFINVTRKCDNEFGCTRNMCWRTCNEVFVNESTFSWCFTTPSVEPGKNAHACREHNDCSPCWSCFGPCNIQPRI